MLTLLVGEQHFGTVQGWDLISHLPCAMHRERASRNQQCHSLVWEQWLSMLSSLCINVTRKLLLRIESCLRGFLRYKPCFGAEAAPVRAVRALPGAELTY